MDSDYIRSQHRGNGRKSGRAYIAVFMAIFRFRIRDKTSVLLNIDDKSFSGDSYKRTVARAAR